MENQVRQIIAYTFEVPAHKLKGDFNNDSIDNWDSLGHHLFLTVELRSAFDVSFLPEETQKFKSFSKIVDAISLKINEKNDDYNNG